MADADYHPAPHNIVAFQSRNALRQPFRIGHAVAISESQYVSAGLCDAAIACWASALFPHDHHSRPTPDTCGTGLLSPCHTTSGSIHNETAADQAPCHNKPRK